MTVRSTRATTPVARMVYQSAVVIEVEVTAEAGPKRVLLPMPFALVNHKRGRVTVDAILGSQFADVPVTKSLDQVTRLEEDKISAYYGGGTLYATPSRQEPML